MGINEAFVARSFLRKLFRLGAERTESERNAIPFLHVESPPGAKVGAPLRLVPADLQNNEALHDDDAEPIYLNELLLGVLLQSSEVAFEKAGIESRDDSAPDDLEQDPSRIPLRLSAHDGEQFQTKAWLELIDVDDDVQSITDADESRITIHLTYMCSNNAKGRSYFSGQSKMDVRKREHGMHMLRNALVGEEAVEGGILCVEINKLTDDSEEEDEYDEELPEGVFFMVNKIIARDGLGNERAAGSVRLSEQRPFDVSFDRPRYVGDPAKVIKKADEEDRSCPGYESVLRELLFLATMSDPHGRPTAVVLSGCSGVGKTRMVCYLFTAV